VKQEVEEMDKKIKCESCSKIIAVGRMPAPVKIKCPHCGAENNLNKPDNTIPYSVRIARGMEKK
jgi:phage FluMu protein Com